MISQKTVEGINEQINKELYSSYLYTSMQAYCADISLHGFSNWFAVQAKEELFHADKLLKFLIHTGNKVSLQKIDEPDSDFINIVDVYEKGLAHEKYVTESLNKLVDTAEHEKDRAAEIFLEWFITEQVEEEAMFHAILQKLKLVEFPSETIFNMDKEFRERKYQN